MLRILYYFYILLNRKYYLTANINYILFGLNVKSIITYFKLIGDIHGIKNNYLNELAMYSYHDTSQQYSH